MKEGKNCAADDFMLIYENTEQRNNRKESMDKVTGTISSLDQEGNVMVRNNKILWILVCTSILTAVCAFAFLPEAIPVHMSAGEVDGYADRAWIFLFPFLQILLLALSRLEAFKVWSMHYKSVTKTETQYNAIIFGVLLFLAVVEVVIILLALFL